MELINKKERNECYRKIRNLYDNNLSKQGYLCGDLAQFANLKSIDDSLLYFEEFALFKPTKQEYKKYKCNITWFSDEEENNNIERKIVLDLCIEMTK